MALTRAFSFGRITGIWERVTVRTCQQAKNKGTGAYVRKQFVKKTTDILDILQKHMKGGFRGCRDLNSFGQVDIVVSDW
jgi:hypothetical protein